VLEEELVRLLPKVLREHPELRQEILSILTGSYVTTFDALKVLEHLERLREDFNRKVEEDNKRFEGIVAELKSLRQDLNALREDFNRKVEEDNKRFEAIMLEIERQRQDFNTLAEQFLSFKKQVGGLEETLGAFVESYYITKVVEELDRFLLR
jgi:Kinetoplastid membrane protein 11.